MAHKKTLEEKNNKKLNELLGQVITLGSSLQPKQVKSTILAMNPFARDNVNDLEAMAKQKKLDLQSALKEPKLKYDSIFNEDTPESEKIFYRELTVKTNQTTLNGVPIAQPVNPGRDGDDNEGYYRMSDDLLYQRIEEYKNRIIGLEYELKRRENEKLQNGCDWIASNFEFELKRANTQPLDDGDDGDETILQ